MWVDVGGSRVEQRRRCRLTRFSFAEILRARGRGASRLRESPGKCLGAAAVQGALQGRDLAESRRRRARLLLCLVGWRDPVVEVVGTSCGRRKRGVSQKGGYGGRRR